MPNQFLTLKDVTAWNGTDDAVGLVDNIVNVAPELDRVLGRPIKGISYRARILTAYGSNAAFRSVGGGVALSAPSFDRKRFNCFPFDCQFEVGEDLLIDREEGETPAEIFEAHATAGVRQKALRIGKQFYLGSANDPKGPPGLIDFLAIARTQVDSRTGQKIDQAVDAGGNSSSCEIVWFIKQGPQGVHWMFGNGRGIVMNPWLRQRVASIDTLGTATPLYRTAWISNLFGYIGLSMANYHAVGAIINVDPSYTISAGTTTFAAGLNDQLIADLWAKFPITEKPDLAFATQKAAASLQAARTVTNFVNGTNRDFTKGIAPVADFPTTLPTAGNIPLIVTDSIVPSTKITLS